MLVTNIFLWSGGHISFYEEKIDNSEIMLASGRR